MTQIDLTSLAPGMITEKALYTEKGDLLLASNVTISQSQIDLLKRRNIFVLYQHDIADDAEELDKVIASQFNKFDPLDIEESAHGSEKYVKKPSAHVPFRTPKAMEFKEIREIKKGKEGLTQLLTNERAIVLDKLTKTQNMPDRPFGIPIEKKCTQIPAGKRTDSYKNSVAKQYDIALKETTRALTMLADGATCEAGQICDIVERFMKIFVTDHCVLLNISGTKHTDEYLFHHSLNVCLLSLNIASAAGYNEQQIIEIGVGALLHDIGMLLVPDEIRFKQGKLTDDERYEIQKHPILGLHLLEKIKRLPNSVPYVSYHVHERENGNGYPKQRNGRLIHGFAKVIQIADIFEAMSSPRIYRPAYLPFHAMTSLINLNKLGAVSGDLLKAFIKYVSLFPIGSLVELSNHAIGKVVQANTCSLAKPVVSVLSDEKGALLPQEQIFQVNLMQETQLSVIRALAPDHFKEVRIMDGF